MNVWEERRVFGSGKGIKARSCVAFLGFSCAPGVGLSAACPPELSEPCEISLYQQDIKDAVEHGRAARSKSGKGGPTGGQSSVAAALSAALAKVDAAQDEVKKARGDSACKRAGLLLHVIPFASKHGL